MKSGDLIQVYRNPDSNPIEEPSMIVGILLDYDKGESGWNILVGDLVECYPDTWWSVERMNQ